ncbi:DUF2793 domain-containing protein [Coralliovum pocilloporae]|uniref:DUF2793 domain-containing protein n=1 Tax=Coralliovum pocilloporae TaxID=3066369 RepID=UPI003307673A
MSDKTARHSLPYIMPSQAQKHVTHNEALRQLDVFANLQLVARDQNTPPQAPADGECYSLGTSPDGSWANRAGQIAAYLTDAWYFARPFDGLRAYDLGSGELLRHDGTQWHLITTQNTSPEQFGINTSADDTNRLAVKSDAILMSHDDVTPGSGDVRLNLNKATDSQTASLIFQTGFSARAEFGLTGDDNWRVKVTSDGSSWNDALIADADTGQMTFPAGLLHPASGTRPQGFVGIDGASTIYRVHAPHKQNPRLMQIASISGNRITLTTADAELVINAFSASSAMIRIWNTSRTPMESTWVTGSPTTTSLDVHSSASIASWSSGDTIQVGEPLSEISTRVMALDVSPMLISKFGQSFRQSGVLAKYLLIGDTNQLTPLQTIDIGLTPTGAGGSFNNATSNNQGVAGQGILYIPCSEKSPVSESNLIFIRETAPSNAPVITMAFVAILGVLVDL